MKKKTKIILSAIVATSIVIGLLWYLYAESMRSKALRSVKETYKDEFVILQKQCNLPTLDASFVEDYYICTMNLSDETLMSYDKQNDLLGFFSTYLVFSSYQHLERFIK